MAHIPRLILDLALILGAAGATTLIFKKLKQPLVLGYILAGVMVGPNFPLFPTIADSETIRIWADIGVIFLLFGLGLEFSFKKLVKVGGSASITGLVEIAAMLILGYLCGQWLGWSTMDSLFLGGIIAISSTTIIIRAFDELGLKTQSFARLVFGILVIEDLVAILLLVLLSTLAVSRQFAGVELVFSILKLSFFLTLWYLAGIYLIPTFLRRTSRLISNETLLILSIGLCLLMVVLVTQAGFSAALGAFIMGSILAETLYAEKIEHLMQPVKDLFGAIFFVSVGMLIDPKILLQYAGPILLLSMVVILGKSIHVTLGALLSGQPLKQSLQTGMSMTQIGEFSFIIATLGLSLNVTSKFLYPIAVAVSAVTTFTTPYLIRLSEPLYQWIEKRLPRRWKSLLDNYSSSTQTITVVSDWREVLRTFAGILITNSVVIIGIVLLSTKIISPFIQEKLFDSLWTEILTAICALSLMAPFLWALSVRKIRTHSYNTLWKNQRYNRGPLVVLEMGRIGTGIVLVGFLLDQLFSPTVALVGAIVLIVIVLPVFTQKLQATYARIEKRFLYNLHAREFEKKNLASKSLLPWDAHIAHFEVSAESEGIGRTLTELSYREKYGVNIAQIERGNKIIHAPRAMSRSFHSINSP
ncbi:cation:proton antiporter domain-containing protein [Rhodocytophaga rosea]|uniref:cation:proton antiporter domain-containing protein n=1 Tax=Rhodocytophaga rosea TaxID=2704465 RepID=UPI001E64A445|nr:cation:proton antiporter [Rhodocytophaga rosea]